MSAIITPLRIYNAHGNVAFALINSPLVGDLNVQRCKNLPDDIVLIIRDYVLDLDTRVAILLLTISETLSVADPNAVLLSLFRKFTVKQLQAMSDMCRDMIFDPNTRDFTPYMITVLPSPITYRRGHTPYTWTPAPNTTPYTDYTVPHPIVDQMGHWSLFSNFRSQKTKRATALVSYVNFLLYTCINHDPFDNALRRMAYNVLAGSLILYREIQRAPPKVHAWQIRYMAQRNQLCTTPCC